MKQTGKQKKRAGRPPLPEDERLHRIHFRLLPRKIQAINRWREQHKDIDHMSTAYQKIVDTHPDIQAIERGMR